jgi:hypothetical protein
VDSAAPAQDLVAVNIDLASVMQADHWKDTRRLMQCGEKVLAKRGGMARAAKGQGRAYDFIAGLSWTPAASIGPWMDGTSP